MKSRKVALTIVVVLALSALPASVTRTWAAVELGVPFAKVYGGPSGFISSSVQQTIDGGFIVAGFTGASSGSGAPVLQTWLLRLDGSGAVVWQKGYATCAICGVFFAVACTNPTACGTTLVLTSIPRAVQTLDGGFVVETNANVSSTTLGVSVFKVDSTGGLVWQRAFTGVGNATGSSVDLTADGGIVVVGSTAARYFTDHVGPFLGTPRSALVVKLDSNGGLAWQKAYSGVGSVSAASVSQTSDGGFVIAGSTGVAGGNAWILRVDSGGSIVWQKTYAGDGSFLLSAEQTTDGGFIAAGVNSTMPTTTTLNPGGALVLRLDSTGSPIWQKNYGGAGALAGSIRQTSDGGFILVGTVGFTPGMSQFSPGTLIVLLDSGGGIVWQKTFNGSALALSVEQTSDGGFVFEAGSAFPAMQGTVGALVVKLDRDGQIISCPKLATTNLAVSNVPFNPTSLTSVAVSISAPPLTTAFSSTNTTAVESVLCPAASQISVSVFFTDSSLNRLPLDSQGNPTVNVTLAGGTVRSTNPGRVLAWVNVTNTSRSPIQSLKLNDSLPVDWIVSPAWTPAVGAIHVFYANTTSLITNPDITQPSTITVFVGNPETVHLAIANLTATAIGHPLMPGQSILLSVKLTYALIGTSQSASSYPRNYTDTATAAAWPQASFTGGEVTGTALAFFVADAKVVS